MHTARAKMPADTSETIFVSAGTARTRFACESEHFLRCVVHVVPDDCTFAIRVGQQQVEVNVVGCLATVYRSAFGRVAAVVGGRRFIDDLVSVEGDTSRAPPPGWSIVAPEIR